MKTLVTLSLLALAAATLPGCPSCEGQARFWSVRDASTNRVAYTVDTAGAPLGGGQINPEYVDESGRMCQVSQPVLTAISEAQYRSQTQGCDYSISYCPVMKTCWAVPRAK